MSLNTRVKKLERCGCSDLTVFASVPLNWTREQSDEVVSDLALTSGTQPPFHEFAIGQAGLCGPRIDGIGSMRELLDHVAKRGKRLGQRDG